MGQKLAMDEDPDEEMEEDEDTLWMRLRALQSMKEKLDQEVDQEEEDNEINEMQELLQEAETAANEELTVPYIPEPAPIYNSLITDNLDVLMNSTINKEDDDDEIDTGEKMSTLVKRLKAAAKKTIEEKNHPQEENYSPSQSPLRDIDADDVHVDFDVIDLTQSPRSEDDLDIIEIIDKNTSTTTTEAAELEFFKHQREEPLFPASVWEFQSYVVQNQDQNLMDNNAVKSSKFEIKKSTDDEVQVIEESPDETKKENNQPSDVNFEAFHEAVLAQTNSGSHKFRRKRARSRGKSVSVSAQEVPPASVSVNQKSEESKKQEVAEEEDVNALRAAVLTSMAEKRTKIEEQKNVKAKKKMAPSSSASSPTPPVKKKKLTGKRITLKEKKKAQDLEKLKAELEKFQDKSIQNKCDAFPITKIHFPNIFCKKVIIPGADLIPSSEEEGDEPTNNNASRAVGKKAGQNQTLLKNVDNFLKLCRSQVVKPLSVKKQPPPKPLRKYPPPKKSGGGGPTKNTVIKLKTLTKTAQLSRSLSQADKENLKRSNISHLPLNKQKEYKRLLKLLAMKEQSKKRSSKKTNTNSVIVEKSKISVVQQHPVKKSDSNSSFHVNSLTQQTNNKQPLAVPMMPPKSNQILSMQRGITVSISDNNKRDVQVSKRDDDEPEKTLAFKEKELVTARKEMCGSLFKLSAEVSQLKEETKKRDTAEQFKLELQRQLAAVEELIGRKNERITNFKNVVKKSHQEIQAQAKTMSVLKKDCKTLGLVVKGTDYEPPQEGMDMMRKKLNVINSSAKRIPQEEENNGIKPSSSFDPPPEEIKPAAVVIKPSKSKSKSSSSSSSSANSSCSSSSSSSSSSDSDSSLSSDDEASVPNASSSALAHLSSKQQSLSVAAAIDPNGPMLCMFQLQGKCNDQSCPYQHHRPK